MTQITWPDHFWRDLVPSCSADTDALRRARDHAVSQVFEASAGRPIVAVSGSGIPGKHQKEAQYIGALIARLGLNLINGGVDGAMLDTAEGFLAAAAKLAGGSALGTVIRVVPSDARRAQKAKELSESLRGAKCIFTELETRSQLGPDSRNHVLVATADVVICLPGQEGSKSEARLAKQVYHKPVIAYGTPGRGEEDWKRSIDSYHIGLTENPEAWLRHVLKLRKFLKSRPASNAKISLLIYAYLPISERKVDPLPHPKALFPPFPSKSPERMTTSDPDPSHCEFIFTRSGSHKGAHMKKVVLTFGLIAGAIISALMDASLLLSSKIGSGHSMALGYTIMVASFLLIYFGIRSYRDNTLGGQITFGRAFACGILITLITTVCYVATWEVLYFNFMPHFMDSYFAAQIHKVQASGLDPAATAVRVAAIQQSQQSYQNPLINAAYTFIEPFPVGLIITLVSATLLRRKAIGAHFVAEEVNRQSRKAEA